MSPFAYLKPVVSDPREDSNSPNPLSQIRVAPQPNRTGAVKP